jgi:pyruvate/2-oxoglutarate dehydrogenase complex dihydrolipoamide acyltransferase (E2) component
MAPMTALVQVDVTRAWLRLEEKDLSPTAYVLACVGRAVAAHPEVHAYRDWLGRLAIHPHVDIATMIEVESSTGLFPLAHVVRQAEQRSVSDLSHELRTTKTRPETGRSGRLMKRWGRIAGWIPGATSLLYAVTKRSSTMRQGTGTVSLSSVGMMIGGSGAAIGVMTLASVLVLVGGATDRPWVVDGEVIVRRILDVTVQIDHRVVDGGPAGRFGATLRRLLEDPDLVEW